MKLNSIILLAMTLALMACSSATHLKQKPVCSVWRDQKYMGAYSIEVAEKAARWTGECKGSHWKCKEIVVSYDERGNVSVGENNVGIIEGNNFTASSNEVKDASLVVNIEKKIVTGKEFAFTYNDKCSTEDAMVGALALGLITEAQKK